MTHIGVSKGSKECLLAGAGPGGHGHMPPLSSGQKKKEKEEEGKRKKTKGGRIEGEKKRKDESEV